MALIGSLAIQFMLLRLGKKLGLGCKVKSFKANTLSRGGGAEFHIRLLRPTESGGGQKVKMSQG